MDTIKKILIVTSVLGYQECFSQKMTLQDIIANLTERYNYADIKNKGVTIITDSQFFNKATSFKIDGKDYEKSSALTKISKIDKTDFVCATYVMYTDNSTYNSSIGIFTKSGLSKKIKKENYDYALSDGFNIKKDPLRDTVYGSGNFALLINGKVVDEKISKQTFYSISYNDIETIHVIWGFQVPYYGENSKNGVIFITLKDLKRDRSDL